MGRKRKSEATVADKETKVPRLSSEEGSEAVAMNSESSAANKQPVESMPAVASSSTIQSAAQSRTKRLRKPRSKSQEEDKIDLQVGYRARFTIGEKEKLLAALKRHGSDDLELLAKSVPTRSALEIKCFIESKKNPKAIYISKKNKAQHAPIQQWLNEANDLTRSTVDYSYMLAQVMAIAGNYELRKQKRHVMSPNYTAIYAYITQLLEGTFPDVTELKSVDAVVILDLLQGLADELKSFDLTNQCKLMMAKYKLLNTKIPAGNPTEAYKAVARALQDDLLETEDSGSDFLADSPKKRPVSSALGSAHEQAKSAAAEEMKDGGVAPSTSVQSADSGGIQRPIASGSNNIKTTTAQADTVQTHSASEKDNTRLNTAQTSIEQVPNTTVRDNIKANTPETNFTQTSKSSNAEIGTMHAKRKRKSSGQGRRYPVIEAKKSKLYTLNPFAIGVKYLRPQKKTTTAAGSTAPNASNVAAGFSSPS